MRRQKRQKPHREPTIALINIVFLMLIFFMVAGSLSQSVEKSLNLVQTSDIQGRAPLDALIIYPNGRMQYRGADQTSAGLFLSELTAEEQKVVRLVPDRELPAQTLVQIARDLRAGGAGQIMIVTERGLK
ncbi:ExbD/TolR family protein [Parasulfitobacter algicola]|uniref:Biopolymer transporter ExbD n=1 Tax=Parasulfitobacter algicola TaxID=2614809 RepID=A0ABX2IUH2_9RHOB|nr:biopolymer transporter ExbD [Sulfitobacter algicola]NSX56205.1 biopolymer transporter ExbD [Sulfitobacter algicola]